MPTANRQLPTANCLLPIAYCLLLIAFSSCKFRQKISLLVHHAKIYTVDEKFTTAEAMAIRDGKIIAIGTNDEIMKAYEGEEELNAEGKTIYPGFIDAHAHFVNYGFSLQQVDLTGTKSWPECIEKVKAFIKNKNIQPGAWVQGRGWDQNDWEVKEFPNKDLLDINFPDNPMALVRIDGHALIANEKAIQLANVKAGQMLEGGTVETINGKLTGIFIDNAEDLIGAAVPGASKQQFIAALKEAQQNCFAMGLTTIQDCGLNKNAVDVIDTLHKEGILQMKLNVMLSDDSANYAYYLKTGPYKTERLNVNGFKLYADGALGSRGACLLQPYSDKPGWRGFTLKDRAYFEKIIPQIYNSKFQANTHAIGDSGNRMVLQVYANVLKGKNDRRWRIEHAQVVNENDFNLFGTYNIIPSVQPTHATSDMYWADKRLGNERVKGAYAYKKLLQQNGWMPLGTDFPVEDISPFKTFFAAVARQDGKGFPAGGFQIENALTRQETLRGMTIWAAKSAFEEKEKGSLEIGKAADFIVLDKDLITCDINDILKTIVNETFINGKKVYKK
jgi:predicted amidohydrolase YtcJ